MSAQGTMICGWDKTSPFDPLLPFPLPYSPSRSIAFKIVICQASAQPQSQTTSRVRPSSFKSYVARFHPSGRQRLPVRLRNTLAPCDLFGERDDAPIHSSLTIFFQTHSSDPQSTDPHNPDITISVQVRCAGYILYRQSSSSRPCPS